MVFSHRSLTTNAICVFLQISVPAPIERQPTDFIPNSEDTSASVSREATQSISPSHDEDVEQLDVQQYRPKVVSVVCRPHEGQKATAPYSIKPVQMVCKLSILFFCSMSLSLGNWLKVD